tara:strand:- start:399 stop:587 length:189 start_codon:yes stop_codon:yes gene_type:complete
MKNLLMSSQKLNNFYYEPFEKLGLTFFIDATTKLLPIYKKYYHTREAGVQEKEVAMFNGGWT